ncbi:MAG: PTS sugar transporter subunit IIB [Desulfovibrio sp.]|uniref:PTS sugar transporter subunit IIB n=1 Tax=Desulfovibrio sp. 7SRBS1 TaxID=3378064 RepID=UPI003B41DF60
MFWARIDNRLIHGQIIETWLPFTGVDTLVIANDDVANDVWRREIMAMAMPTDIRLYFVEVEDVGSFLHGKFSGAVPNAMVLFANCSDARRAYDSGLRMTTLNIGNLHFSPGKRQIAPNIALSLDDEACLLYFEEHHITLDFRCIPSDTAQVRLT